MSISEQVETENEAAKDEDEEAEEPRDIKQELKRSMVEPTKAKILVEQFDSSQTNMM